MDYTTLVAESKAGQEQSTKGMQSLYQVCQQVVDGRCARGKRVSRWQACWSYWCWPSWQACRAWWGKVDWVKDQQELLREELQLSWKRMPCANTYSYALARLDSQQVNAALAAWFVRKAGREPLRKGTKLFSGTAKRAARASGGGWQSLERHWQAGLWGRGPTEAGAACV